MIPKPLFGDPLGVWYRKFAWLPVRTYDQQMVWLRYVMRRCICKHNYLDGGADFWYQYAACHDPLLTDEVAA